MLKRLRISRTSQKPPFTTKSKPSDTMNVCQRRSLLLLLYKNVNDTRLRCRGRIGHLRIGNASLSLTKYQSLLASTAEIISFYENQKRNIITTILRFDTNIIQRLCSGALFPIIRKGYTIFIFEKHLFKPNVILRLSKPTTRYNYLRFAQNREQRRLLRL